MQPPALPATPKRRRLACYYAASSAWPLCPFPPRRRVRLPNSSLALTSAARQDSGLSARVYWLRAGLRGILVAHDAPVARPAQAGQRGVLLPRTPNEGLPRQSLGPLKPCKSKDESAAVPPRSHLSLLIWRDTLHELREGGEPFLLEVRAPVRVELRKLIH